MKKETAVECYMFHTKENIAEMLYETISRYESKKCESCKWTVHKQGCSLLNIVCPDNFGCTMWEMK